MQWKETDVLVLGYGNGSNAAIAAADAGQKFLFWKTAAGGGNVSVLRVGLSFRQTRKTIISSKVKLYEICLALSDKDLLDLLFWKSSSFGRLCFFRWLRKEKISVYGHEVIKTQAGCRFNVNKMSMRNVPGAKGGDRLFGIFDRAVKARNIPVLVNCPARRLVRRGNEVLVSKLYTGKSLVL